jgi:ABC-type uncharacterized transport system ATPase subunit
MQSDAPTHSVEVKDLWFSYEVTQNTSATAKTLDETKKAILRDGGLSVDAPRRQYDEGKEVVYKLQLAGVNMELPMGARCLLIGANGAGKTTLLSVLGGKHMVDQQAVRVLGRAAFEDTTLSAELALLTGNWTHTVSFVGHNVPYAAMEVRSLIASNSVGVDPARVARLVSLLEVDENWNLTTVSDGQRRRVQILCKLIKPFRVLLLDEITTDLDLLARHELLAFLREESEERGVTIVYCTHIFDGLDGWASHISYVEKGKMVFASPVSALTERLVVSPEQANRGWGQLFCAAQRWLLAARPDFAKLVEAAMDGSATMPPPAAGATPAVSIRDFSWGYSAAKPPQLNHLSSELPAGARCLLVGANGAGKTTLLRLLGGKHMVPEGSVECLGRPCFHDLELNTLTALLSGDWTRQVACVGSGVPFQADFSVGSMAEALSTALVRDGADAQVINARLARLVELLDMDMSWRLHQVSDGQRRRAQLLLKLLRPSQLLLMDEVTTDLDVVSRQALLHFLREESDMRGATVVYSTHIFDGLDQWPTHILHLSAGAVKYCGPIGGAPGAAEGLKAAGATAQSSGSLYTLVKHWLLDEQSQLRRSNRSVDCESTPTTASAIDGGGAAPMETDVAAAPPPMAKPTSKFDRFGGASRQGMYAR